MKINEVLITDYNFEHSVNWIIEDLISLKNEYSGSELYFEKVYYNEFSEFQLMLRREETEAEIKTREAKEQLDLQKQKEKEFLLIHKLKAKFNIQ